MAEPAYKPLSLLEIVKKAPDINRIVIAFSGGLDSHVLVHSIFKIRKELNKEITVIHVNHGIHDNSDMWSEHCKQVCAELGADFISLNITRDRKTGENLESWARDMRYELFTQTMKKNDALLTAHHKDDQAETFLLQLLRGAGAKGLASMPVIRDLPPGYHLRPLLGYSRKTLREYAINNKLNWIDDDSNRDISFNRNFIRHRVMPLLQEKWSNASEQISRAAGNMSETMLLLNVLAEQDFNPCMTDSVYSLNIRALLKLSRERQKNVIRYWLESNHYSMPSSSSLNIILTEVVGSSSDSVPVMLHDGVEIRRYKDHLMLVVPLPVQENDCCYDWNLNNTCDLALGNLTAYQCMGKGIKADLCDNNHVQIRFRKGGEKIKPGGKQHSKDLKKIFQENNFYPWYRNYIPLLYVDERLASVAGFCTALEFEATDSEIGWVVSWSELNRAILKANPSQHTP